MRLLLNQVKEILRGFCLRQTSKSEKSDISVGRDVLSAEGTIEQFNLFRTLSMQLKSLLINKRPCERKKPCKSEKNSLRSEGAFWRIYVNYV